MSATAAVVRTEARLFSRELGSVFWIIAFPTLLVCVLGLVPPFREDDPGLGGQSVVDLYVAVAVLLSMIMASIQAMPAVLGGYRERGILRRLRATPVSPHALLGAQVALHAAATVVSATLTLVVARIVFGTPLPTHLPGYVVAFVLALASAMSVGAAVTALSPNAKVATVVGSVVFFPAMFTAGVWLPVQTMPSMLQTIVLYTPFGAAARALNDALVGSFPEPRDLAVMGVWSVVLWVASARMFRWQ
jgi:ABC-2 type transport system permease protein